MVTLLFYLRAIIGPLLIAFLLTYLLHPAARTLSNRTRLSWRASVNIVYFLLLILILGTSTAIGFAVVNQAQLLIRLLERTINDIPEFLESITTQVYFIGPFQINPDPFLDINILGDQIISAFQQLLGQAGALVGSLATSAASTATMTLFVLLISYFTLADAGKVPDPSHFIKIPGYEDDIRRISRALGRIWNAFLRGQITFVILVAIGFSVLFSILGTRYALALGALTGIARFVPYLGQTVSWVALVVVTLFQPNNYFGLSSIQYTLLVLALSFILDQIYDNMVNPRIMGHQLNISPGAVLIVAIIGVNLIGIIGLILAAPVFATIQLIGGYVLRKLADQDPWPEPEPVTPEKMSDLSRRITLRLRAWWKRWRDKRKKPS
jgi:predicted PurR-regulated permease PerM